MCGTKQQENESAFSLIYFSVNSTAITFLLHLIKVSILPIKLQTLWQLVLIHLNIGEFITAKTFKNKQLKQRRLIYL